MSAVMSRLPPSPACAESLEPRIALAVFTVANANDAGAGSLRQAILNANAVTSADEINFDPAFFGSVPRTISLLSALPQFSGSAPLTITGPGSHLLTVRRSTTTQSVFGVFSSAAPAINMSGITVTGGNANGNGAGILIIGSGPRATFDDLVVTGNTATGDGGGISLTNNSALMLRNCVVTNNSARIGGGIFFFSNGALVIENSRIAGNTSTISTGGGGGGVYFFGQALASPPAGFTPDALVFRNSTVEGNSAARSGGGIYVETFFGTLLVQNSTINGNTAAIAGGGVCANIGGNGSLIFQNTTVSGNTAGTAGGGIAIPEGAYSATLQNSTVTGNSANGTAATQGGGGVSRTTLITGTITIVNSVVSGNNNPGGSAPDIRANAQSTARINFSAVGSNGGFTFAAGSGNNRPPGENPMLGALANNGGPTRTHLPAAGSPLINSGSNTDAAQFTTDQRGPGYPRIQGTTVDIGAVERDPPPTVLAAEYHYVAVPPFLRFAFSEQVGGSLAPGDLLLRNLTAGADVSTDNIDFGYDAQINHAYFNFPGYPNGALPDGNYRATLTAAGVIDAADNPLPANYVFDFYVLAGDANRDRRVDFPDLVVLAQNYNATGRNFAQGNFNYDPTGAVDFQDLVLLAQRYNTSLPAPAAPEAVAPAVVVPAGGLPQVLAIPAKRPGPKRSFSTRKSA